ncbi:MAG: DUF3299 domain-containing protein [Gammaproteobacteria bacterium]|nr:DUF3299 domain-containing protein [Gammaproteobacteria bacterium]NIM73119.1 DUF3299 domain-containing protein [Gammaproteobacteria bacterium]NIN38799.1 DUF3299 domain-containing protein [Gammaproteobacteria bacterium]NIO24874.1 DUF3299 domain-containing protein [Gammaproteobacteria bacterium]NIO65476.1 DUF3299 domain-containing protein [Gammaproteobacteria bacterium]
MIAIFNGRYLLLLAMTLCVALMSQAAIGSEAREIKWDDLMPDDWRPFDPYMDLDESQLNQLYEGSPLEQQLMRQYIEAMSSAPVVAALDGERVRIPGYVVPLDFAGTELSEFLLVPYFGACIHVPPPPSNQIIYVKSENAFKVEGLFTAVWVTGTISTQAHLNDLGDAGYTIEATKVELHKLPGE